MLRLRFLSELKNNDKLEMPEIGVNFLLKGLVAVVRGSKERKK